MASVLIPLAEGCEELEAVTVIDLLRRANIDVTVAGLSAGPIIASRGTVLLADTTLDDVLDNEYDMIVLPGGLPGSDYLEQDPRIQTLIKRQLATGKYTAAICAAPKVLASCGLLDGKQFTAYPGVLDEQLPDASTLTGTAVVSDGLIITSRGPGTAMDFALTLIETLTSGDVRDQVETGLVRS